MGQNWAKVDNGSDQEKDVPEDLADIMLQGAAVFSFLNVLLLVGLMTIYGNSFRKIRAEFTIGLFFFAAMFLAENLIALYSYLTMFMYFASDVGPLVMTITIAQTVGLGALLWMSAR